MSVLFLHSKTGWTIDFILDQPIKYIEYYLAFYNIQADYEDPDSKRFKEAAKRKEMKKIDEANQLLKDNGIDAELVSTSSTSTSTSADTNKVEPSPLSGVVNFRN